jgi:hypothetical protein
LSVSYLEEHQFPIFVANQWAKRATNISELTALLERNYVSAGKQLTRHFFVVYLGQVNPAWNGPCSTVNNFYAADGAILPIA